MARAVRREDPYDSVIGEILALASRKRGWNSYEADETLPSALVSAIGLVHRFRNLPAPVPPPSVGALADGRVVLRWLTPDREVEIVYFGHEMGEYSVCRRGTRDPLEEASLQRIDPLKDIVDAHVLGHRRLDQPRW
jgi:hypothetical protein